MTELVVNQRRLISHAQVRHTSVRGRVTTRNGGCVTTWLLGLCFRCTRFCVSVHLHCDGRVCVRGGRCTVLTELQCCHVGGRHVYDVLEGQVLDLSPAFSSTRLLLAVNSEKQRDGESHVVFLLNGPQQSLFYYFHHSLHTCTYNTGTQV